jgi:hypothetical protein
VQVAAANEEPGGLDFQDMANIGTTSQLYFDLATAALACDRTRIITMQYLNTPTTRLTCATFRRPRISLVPFMITSPTRPIWDTGARARGVEP